MSEIEMKIEDNVGFSEGLKFGDNKGGRKVSREGSKRARVRKDDKIVLKNNARYTNILMEVATSSKKESELKIKGNLESWVNNPEFDDFEEKDLDLAIIAYVNKNRMSRQDVDNIAKVVIDALQDNEEGCYLIKDDNQIRRLLVEKRRRVPDKDFETDDAYISFREHQQSKPLLLKKPDIEAGN